jgi:hypothetical protein
MSARSRVALLLLAAAALALCGCTTSRPRPFQLMAGEERWAEAVHAFESDSTLLQDPDALFQGALLFGSPNRPAYHPERAVALLEAFVQRFPRHRHRDSAEERLTLLREVVALRQEVRQLKAIDLSRP